MSGAAATGQPRRPSILRRAAAAVGGPSGLLGAIIAAVMVFLAVFAPLVAPHNPLAVNLDHQFAPPGEPYWFGTDQSGRDVLSRVIWGSRPSLEVGIVSVVVGFAGGVALGLAAGFYNGGWFEQIVMRCLEAMASIPLLIWAIAIVGILGVEPFHVGPFVFGNQIKVMGLLGLLYIPGLARITYVAAVAETRSDYVAARRLQGVSGWRIMLSDVLPNCLSPVIVQATLLVATGIIIEAAISFVGLGVQPPQPSWGTMLSDARNYLFSGEWWLSLFPGLAISFTVIGFNLLGDGLRDVLDPRRNATILTA